MPLAIPLVAGPSAMATILLLMARQPDRWPNWLLAIFCAWLASGAILYFATFLGSVLGERGSTTIQRLFGMLLTTLAVPMFRDGIREFLALD